MKATLLIRPPRTSCDACEKRDVVVRVGDQPDPEARNPWERTAELCLPCLLEAVAVFQQEDGNPCSDCEKIVGGGDSAAWMAPNEQFNSIGEMVLSDLHKSEWGKREQ